MGKKKNSSDNGGGDKKDDSPVTLVLNIDMHCEGCTSKIIKTARGFQEGVESVKAESKANKLTLIGKLNPCKVQQSLAQKTKMKVEIVSPKKDKKNDGENNQNDDGGDGDKKKMAADNNFNDKAGEKEAKDKDQKKKSKETPITTAILKLSLHCQGCLQKIHKTICRTKGFIEISIDKEKELVTVKGAMDMKVLAENLKVRLKRPVEIVPPKKEKNGERGNENGNDEPKDGANDNNGGGGKKKNKGGANGGQEQGGANGASGKIEGNKIEHLGPFGFGYGIGFGNPNGFPVYGHVLGNAYVYPPYQYGAEPPMQFHALHEMFSEENPNACSVM